MIITIILNLIFHMFFILSAVDDIRTKIIPEKFLIVMFISVILKLLFKANFFDVYYSVAIFILPIFIIMIIETYLEKELIGLGDIKLFILIALYFSNTNLVFVYKYYFILVISSSIMIFFKKITEYIALVPFMYFSFLVVLFYE